METTKLLLEPAQPEDAAAIAALRLTAARALTAQHGTGTWSYAAESEGGVRLELHGARVLIARDGPTVIATLRLTTRNPWLGDISFFTRCDRPIYLTSMAVRPDRQRHGLGRRCLEEARAMAAHMRGEMLRLDSYDAPAGAGDFYRKCGFREVRRAPYHGTPLIFFESVL